MLKEENAELIIDGKRVENDYTFVADDEEMKVEISYTVSRKTYTGCRCGLVCKGRGYCVEE